MIGQLPDGAEVGLQSTLAQAGGLEALEHPLAEGRGHVLGLVQSRERKPLQGTLRHGPRSFQEAANPQEIRLPSPCGRATPNGVDSSCRASGLLELTAAAEPLNGTQNDSPVFRRVEVVRRGVRTVRGGIPGYRSAEASGPGRVPGFLRSLPEWEFG